MLGGSQRLQHFSQASTPLSRLSPFNSFEEASREVLAWLHQRLGLSLWMTVRKAGEDWIVLQAEDHGYGMKEGSVLRWSDSLCGRMFEGRGPRVAPVLSEIPAYAQAPVVHEKGIGAYIGVPIEDENGDLYGTLCAWDPHEQDVALVDHLPLVELFAQLLASIQASDARMSEQARCAERAQLTREALTEERWRLESILKGTNVGSWEWNVQTGETIFNERWAEIIGYTLEEISPVSIDTWVKFAHPDDLQRSNELLEKHFKGELEYYEFESRMRHKDGSWVWVFDRGRVFSWTEDGKPLMMFGTHQDINHRKNTELALRESEERFHEMARTDGLTGLLNRRGWEECLSAEESRQQRYRHSSCVIVVDLDGLKGVNDAQGHKAGDDLIRRAARCIQGAVREVDQVARMGGDEFTVLAIECGERCAKAILDRIEEALSRETISASLGMALCDSSTGFEAAVAQADRLMYEMKARHRLNAPKPV